MNEEPPAKRLRLGKLWWWLLAIFLGACGWQMWSIHKYNAAVREAEEAGFEWECEDTISLIKQDWRNALKKETWGAHDRILGMGEVPDLGRYREMLHSLRPTVLTARRCENVDGMEGLTSLQSLILAECGALRNVDGLKGLTDMKRLDLGGCSTLQNVDGLKGLTGLQVLLIQNCWALQNVHSLKGIKGLQEIYLNGCCALQSVDVLKGLTSLQTLWLHGCKKIPAAELRELRAALPKTDITFPDGTKEPPE